ncbi:hypothetical protein F5884DRAFT_418504 [Xylogone sp. PMI_703]|nr:hypothetical protein F5884DRAFT_418504 [Xylogone sp. PMI_703]
MASDSLLPPGFPAELRGSMAWDGLMYKDSPGEYIRILSRDDLAGIDTALRHFQGLGLAPGHISPEKFPLPPRLKDLLAGISEEIHEGRGFGVLRGLDPQRFTPEENVIVFAGISSYVGERRATDSSGLTLSHIRNAMKDRLPDTIVPEMLRPSKRPEGMVFHSDAGAGDILAMYIKGLQDGSGGDQFLASSWLIYNTLAREDPHVIQILANDFPWEEIDQETKNPRCALRPLIFFVEDKLQIQYVTVPLRGSLDHPRPKELPVLSAAQEAALDKLQALAEHVPFKLDRVLGDIQFINNLSIMHARTAFCEEPGQKLQTMERRTISPRHFLRLFLQNKSRAWAKPQIYQKRFEECFSVAEEKQNLPAVDYDPADATASTGLEAHG